MEMTSPDDALRGRELRQTRAMATGLLLLCLGVLVGARLLMPRYPVLGYVAAFAEAAAIGGIADWYAVVALFRRPLGLPIPHTAIVPHNQARIADSLGGFIARHFLASEPVDARLREVDFAALAADWLSRRENSDDLARFALRLLPQAVAAMDSTGLRRFLARRAVEQLEALPVAPLAAGILLSLTSDGRHQRILDEVLVVLRRLLDNQTALDAIRDKIRNELPTLFNLFRADAYLLRRLVGSTSAFIEEVQQDAAHPVRGEFDRFVRDFIVRLEGSPDFAARLESMKQELLQRPEITALSNGIWNSIEAFVGQQATAARSPLRKPLRNLLVQIGRHLNEDAALRADINRGMVLVLGTFVANHRQAIAGFVADQVKSWDTVRLIEMIELNVGRDLQYIRFNGTLIGGLVGLILYSVQHSFALL